MPSAKPLASVLYQPYFRLCIRVSLLIWMVLHLQVLLLLLMTSLLLVGFVCAMIAGRRELSAWRVSNAILTRLQESVLEWRTPNSPYHCRDLHHSFWYSRQRPVTNKKDDAYEVYENNTCSSSHTTTVHADFAYSHGRSLPLPSAIDTVLVNVLVLSSDHNGIPASYERRRDIREFRACDFLLEISAIGTPVPDLSLPLLKFEMESCWEFTVFEPLGALLTILLPR